MHKLEANAANDFPSIWSSFLTFETVSRRRDERLDAFISRWEEKMGLAQSAGCDFSDTVLACKLLQKANLDEKEVKEIVNSISFGNSEMLNTLLCILAVYPVEKSKRVKEETANCDIDSGISGRIKEEFQVKHLNVSEPVITLKEEGLPELEIKDELSEASLINVDLSELAREENKTGTDDCDEGTQGTERKRNIIGNRHQCHICHKSFSTAQAVNKHIMRWHTKERPFQCSQCSYSTVDKYYINIHIRRKHHGERPFKCPLCEKAFKYRRTLKFHTMRLHTNEQLPFQCPHCSYSSENGYNLTVHVRSHTGEKPFKCMTCEKAFPCKKRMDRHIMKEHTNEPLPYQCSQCSYSAFLKCSLDQHIRSHTGERPFKCLVCGKEYANKQHLTRHMVNAHEKDEKEKNQFGCYKTENVHSMKLEEEESALPESKSFSETLVKHVSGFQNANCCDIVQIQAPKSQCEHCGKSISRKFIQRHQNKCLSWSQNTNCCDIVQIQAPKSQCEHCGKSISHKFIKRHRKKCLSRSQGKEPVEDPLKIRKKTEKLQCEHCGKGTSQRYLKEHYLYCPNLDQEEREAKGYASKKHRKVTCEICHKTFAREHNYTQHLALHSGERNFKCDECPKTFASPYYLTLHKARHGMEKNHHCEDCTKSFHTKDGLTIHRRREHTYERPFQCPHCSYCTVSSSHLNRHVRSHTGETPFKCNLCGKLYRDRKSVKRHLNAHHGFFDVKYIGRNPVNKPEEEKFVENLS